MDRKEKSISRALGQLQTNLDELFKLEYNDTKYAQSGTIGLFFWASVIY